MKTDWATDTRGTGQYAEVNGLKLYYETHGAGRPMILLHGGLMSGETFGPVIGALAADHRVVLPDLQGHGRTADIDRPLTYEQVADDTALPRSGSGLPRDWDRILSAPFVLHPDYGTRCSTVVLLEPGGRLYLAERRFDPRGEAAGETEFELNPGEWP